MPKTTPQEPILSKQEEIRHGKTTNIDNVVIEMNINHFIREYSKLEQSIRLETTVWACWFTRNCARDWNLIILTNGKCTKTIIYPWEWDTETPLGFWDTNWSPNLPISQHQWKTICSYWCENSQGVNNNNKSEKKVKYYDFDRELIKLCNMRWTFITSANGGLKYSQKRKNSNNMFLHFWEFFDTSVSWCIFTEVRVIASILKFHGLISVFWLISIILFYEWVALLCPSHPVPVRNH